MERPTYREANELSKKKTGHGVSTQAYSLRSKFKELDEALHGYRDLSSRVIEVHPEVSFRELANMSRSEESRIPSKKTWSGQWLRLNLLEQAGLFLPKDLGVAGEVPTDDLLDAAAAAWTAQRYFEFESKSFPSEAERGQSQVIWR